MEKTFTPLETNHNMPGLAWSWLTGLRKEALNAWQETGFPSKKQEAWKYTSTYELSQQYFAPVVGSVNTVDQSMYADALLKSAIQFHIHNGQCQTALNTKVTLPQGVILMSFASALEQQLPCVFEMVGLTEENAHGFHALNTALMQDGFVLIVPRDVEITTPIQILYYHSQEQAAFHMRNLIILEDNAKATLIETFLGDPRTSYFTNVITEVSLGKHAGFNHYKILQEIPTSYHIGTLNMDVAAGAKANAFSSALEAKWARSDTRVSLNGIDAETSLYGLYALNGQQHLDHHTEVLHCSPQCISSEDYRGVLGGHATGVFNGQVWVAPGASKTKAHQINKNLILSPNASINTKPQLEIFNDDVKCSHGATIGELDKNALFFLQSRGISLTEAQNLLVNAFANDIIDAFANTELQDWLRRAFENKKLFDITGESHGKQ